MQKRLERKNNLYQESSKKKWSFAIGTISTKRGVTMIRLKRQVNG